MLPRSGLVQQNIHATGQLRLPLVPEAEGKEVVAGTHPPTVDVVNAETLGEILAKTFRKDD